MIWNRGLLKKPNLRLTSKTCKCCYVKRKWYGNNKNLSETIEIQVMHLHVTINNGLTWQYTPKLVPAHYVLEVYMCEYVKCEYTSYCNRNKMYANIFRPFANVSPIAIGSIYNLLIVPSFAHASCLPKLGVWTTWFCISYVICTVLCDTSCRCID